MSTERKKGNIKPESIEPDLFDVDKPQPTHFTDIPTPVTQRSVSKPIKPSTRWWHPITTLFRWIFKTTLLFALLMALGVGGIWGVYLHFSEDLPTLNSLADYHPNLLTRVFARDYQLMGEFYIQRRQFIPRTEMPQKLIDALLSIEDSRFYQHPGIDVMGMARALIANVKAGGKKVQGASTITQQVARTFLLTSIKSMERKIKEIILSLRIEQQFTKDEILELYFNQIYMGAGAYGMGAAAHAYFNRDVSELSLGQMALLAGLPKAPSAYSPWKAPEKARARQKLVLQRMAELGHITPEEASAAMDAPLNLSRPKESLEQVAPHYLEHVRRTIIAEWGTYQLYNGGLEVFTALNPRLQRAAQTAVQKGLIDHDRRRGYRGPLAHLTDLTPKSREEWLKKNAKTEPTIGGFLRAVVLTIPKKKEPATILLTSGQEVTLPFEGMKWARLRQSDKKYAGRAPKKIADVLAPGDIILVDPPKEKRTHYDLAQEPNAEAALVCMDPHTGQILAMVGGYDFGRSEFNRATQSIRQPGSAFKPFLFTAAMDKGFSPVSLIDDSPLPLTYRDSATGAIKVWEPQNYERKSYGPTTLRAALTHSRNLVTVRLAQTLGIAYFASYLQNFGLEIPTSRYDLSLSLGSLGFSPLKMTSAYSVFANGGKRMEPVYITRVQDRYGRTVFRHSDGDCLLCHQEPEKIIPQPGESINTPLFGKPILNPASIYQVVNLMKGVVRFGTGRRALSLNRPVAGKTGTTNDLRDAWFMGFSPSLVTGVWVGKDDFSILGETGSQVALPIWTDYMQEALKGQPITDFAVPPGIFLEEIDADTGQFPGGETEHTVYESFKPGQMPLMPEDIIDPSLYTDDEAIADDNSKTPSSTTEEMNGGLY